MRHALAGVAAMMVLIGVAARADSGKPSLSAKVMPPTATVGDPVTVDLGVTLPPGDRAAMPRFPDWQDHWGEAEINGAESPVKASLDDGSVRWTQRLHLTAFRTGHISLPPKEIVIAGDGDTETVQTPSSLALSISSVLPAGAEASSLKPKPAASLHALPWGGAFWWSLGVGLAALLGTLWWARRRGGSEAPEAPPVPLLPPFEELERGLESLASVTDSMRLHLELSRRLRRYLGRTLNFPAVESTTTEIRRRLKGVRLSPDLVRRAVALLRCCDEVKFARLGREEDLDAHRQEAHGIAERVERHLNPPAPEIDEEAAA
jgi:hypothetical protein